jgi:hypothetical protein
MSDLQPDDLAAFVADVSGTGLRVEENLGSGFVRLRVEEAERRQAVHDIRCIEDAVVELLRNARDAGAHHIFLSSSREGERRVTTVVDDGAGIPQELHERIFDARVTSKLDTMLMDRWGVHGRGMALFSVRENAESARVMASEPGKGTSVQVVTNASRLSERADQSSWPSMGKDDDGKPAIVRGPHNILRCCCEFALEEHERCRLFVGSAGELVATARKRMKPRGGSSNLLFVDDIDELPLLERLYVAADARELAEVASRLGWEISERTAHRVLAGTIRPLRSVYARLTHKAREAGTGELRTVDLERDRRGLRISREDAREFARMMERDFSWLAERYYLELASEPRVSSGAGRVTVTFDVREE